MFTLADKSSVRISVGKEEPINDNQITQEIRDRANEGWISIIEKSPKKAPSITKKEAVETANSKEAVQTENK